MIRGTADSAATIQSNLHKRSSSKGTVVVLYRAHTRDAPVSRGGRITIANAVYGGRAENEGIRGELEGRNEFAVAGSVTGHRVVVHCFIEGR